MIIFFDNVFIGVILFSNKQPVSIAMTAGLIICEGAVIIIAIYLTLKDPTDKVVYQEWERKNSIAHPQL